MASVKVEMMRKLGFQDFLSVAMIEEVESLTEWHLTIVKL